MVGTRKSTTNSIGILVGELGEIPDRVAGAEFAAEAAQGVLLARIQSSHRERSRASGMRVEKKAGDKHVATDWTKSPNDREAFKDESHRIDSNGGTDSTSNYNQIESPGKKYTQQDQRIPK
jgi:hypothetical protein